MREGVTTIDSGKPGKTLVIMAGVHGNEICGTQAFRKLLPNIRIDRGRVHFILGNLRAIEQNIRQTEMNMNRAFRPEHLLSETQLKSYERGRALALMPFLDESDMLLDVHSSFSKQSTPFIICEPRCYPIAERLAFPIRSHGWDIIEPGGTDYYMSKQGKVGICIECGYDLDENAPVLAEESIQAFLEITGAIESTREFPVQTQRVIDAYAIHITETNFTPSREFADFEKLDEGECIGHDGDKPILAPPQSAVIFCRAREGAEEEAFILGREES